MGCLASPVLRQTMHTSLSPTSSGCCTRFKKELRHLSCDTRQRKMCIAVQSGSNKICIYIYIYIYSYIYISHITCTYYILHITYYILHITYYILHITYYIYTYILKIVLVCYAQYICSQNLILTIGISCVSFDISIDTAISCKSQNQDTVPL